MYNEYPVTGLKKHEITVNDKREIRLAARGRTIKIGDLEALYKLGLYEDGTYTTDKGIVIHLEGFIDEMAITDTMAQNIKRTRPEKEDPDNLLNKRMHRFHGILYNRLRGDIKKKESH